MPFLSFQERDYNSKLNVSPDMAFIFLDGKKSLIFCIILVSDNSNAQSLVQLVQYLHITLLFSLSFGISSTFPDICKMLQ